MRSISFVVFFVLFGCATVNQAPVELGMTYVDSEYDDYKKTGSGKIMGQAFLKQNGGGVVTCAGESVILMPDTNFFRAVVDSVKTRKKLAEPKNFDHTRVMKKVTCDAQGNFLFENLPKAKWIVLTQVMWKVGYSSQGGALVEYVDINEDQQIKTLVMSKSLASK